MCSSDLLMARVEIRPDDALEARHRREGVFPAAVTAVLKDGSLAEEACDGPWVGVDDAAFGVAILAKARALMAAKRSPREIEAIVSAVMSLGAAASLADLWQALRRSGTVSGSSSR